MTTNDNSFPNKNTFFNVFQQRRFHPLAVDNISSFSMDDVQNVLTSHVLSHDQMFETIVLQEHTFWAGLRIDRFPTMFLFVTVLNGELDDTMFILFLLLSRFQSLQLTDTYMVSFSDSQPSFQTFKTGRLESSGQSSNKLTNNIVKCWAKLLTMILQTIAPLRPTSLVEIFHNSDEPISGAWRNPLWYPWAGIFTLLLVF